MEEITQELGLSFMLSPDGLKLLARFEPRNGGVTLDLADLRRLLEAGGWGKYFLFPPFLSEVVKKCAAGLPFEQVIGEARDAEFAIQIDSSKMAAYLTISPAAGGRPVDRVLVYRKIEELGLVAGLDFDAIDRAIAAGQAEGVLVASGRQPMHGEDGRLENLITEMKERRPRLDEKGIANFRDMGDITIVHAGAQLMRRVPPTSGTPGETILGQVIPAIPGKGAMFAANLSGVDFDPADPNVLAATITGQPVQVKNGVVVEPTYVTSVVDLSTGNVVFEGTVKVQGDVQAGMTIRASGDIHIAGTVEAATLDAGGDIVVKGGVIGRMDARDKEGAEDVSHVRCGGSFNARFVQNAQIEAGEGIFIDEMVMQSDLVAGNQVVVGREGSAKGHIVGGTMLAALLVKAQVIGSPSHIRTVVSVGINPQQHELMKRLAREREEREKALEDVARLIAFAAQNPGRIPPDALAKAEKTRQVALDRIEALHEELDGVTHQIELSKNACVVVGRTLCGGAEVQLGGKLYRAAEEREGGVFSLRDGELSYDILPWETARRQAGGR